jgi:choice-of-anchor C domain-containing protein
LAQRARIGLLPADNRSNTGIAADLGVCPETVPARFCAAIHGVAHPERTRHRCLLRALGLCGAALLGAVLLGGTGPAVPAAAASSATTVPAVAAAGSAIWPEQSAADLSGSSPGGPERSGLLADGNLVSGGSFEPPAADTIESYETVDATQQTKLGGWNVTAGSVDLIGAGWGKAADGVQFVDLTGNTGDGERGTISQTLTTIAGHGYRVQFSLAGNPNGDTPSKSMDASLGPAKKSYTIDVGPGDDLAWEQRTFDVTICQTSAALDFTSTTDDTHGPLIDAVSVVDLGEAAGCGGSAAAGAAPWEIVMLTALGLAWLAAFVFLGRRLVGSRVSV